MKKRPVCIHELDSYGYLHVHHPQPSLRSVGSWCYEHGISNSENEAFCRAKRTLEKDSLFYPGYYLTEVCPLLESFSKKKD